MMNWIASLSVIGVLLLAGCGGGSGGSSSTVPVSGTEPAPPVEPAPVEPPPVEPSPIPSDQIRVYQLGDVVEFSGTLSIEEAPNPATTADVMVRVEFIDNVYSREGKNVLGMQTTTTFVATGEQMETTRHIWQEENGALFDLTDEYGNYYMDSATNEYGIPSIPSPLIPFEQIECQCYIMYGGHTSGALAMGTRTILVGEQEDITVPLGAFAAYPVTQESEYTYTFSYDIFKRDDSVVVDETNWVSLEMGIVKIKGNYRRYSSTGKLISAETLDIEATKTNF